MSSILVYGPPGSGKTTLASTMTKLGLKVHYLDMDRKVENMANLASLIKEGKITWWAPISKLLEGDLATRVMAPKKPPAKKPGGYLELAEYITKLEKEPLEDANNTVLVLDSITKVSEHMRRLILHLQGKGSLEFQDWGFILANMEELFDCFYALGDRKSRGDAAYRHVIINAHDAVDKDEITGRTLIRPLMDGQMKSKAGAYVEEMYYTQVDVNRDGEAVYNVITRPLKRVAQARTSRDIETTVTADFAVLFKDRA